MGQLRGLLGFGLVEAILLWGSSETPLLGLLDYADCDLWLF
jgi:hypothetical protein